MRNSDGNPHRDLGLNTIEEREKHARLWSEGRESLYNLLMFCMDNNIKTVACCAGHEETDPKGYIGFDMNDPRTRDIIMKLISHKFYEKENLNITTIGNNTDCSAYLYSNETEMNDEFFLEILKQIDEITKGKEVEIDSRAQRILSVSEEVCKNKDLPENSNVQFCYNAFTDKLYWNLDIKECYTIHQAYEMGFEESINIINMLKENIKSFKTSKRKEINPVNAAREALESTTTDRVDEAVSIKESNQDKTKDGVIPNEERDSDD